METLRFTVAESFSEDLVGLLEGETERAPTFIHGDAWEGFGDDRPIFLSGDLGNLDLHPDMQSIEFIAESYSIDMIAKKDYCPDGCSYFLDYKNINDD